MDLLDGNRYQADSAVAGRIATAALVDVLEKRGVVVQAIGLIVGRYRWVGSAAVSLTRDVDCAAP